MLLEHMYQSPVSSLDGVGGMVFSSSEVLCRKNGIREELTYSFIVAGKVGRRVAFTVIS